MEVLAIIPARKGSKGIKNKNIALLGGKPLMAWSIACATKSKYVTRTIVSTDSDEYAEIAKQHGADVPFLRPDEIATGEIHSVHVVIHALKYLKINENYQPDIVIMLLPTSPFRSTSTLDDACEAFFDQKPTSLISVVEAKKQLLHFRYIRNGILEPIQKSHNYNIQRQDVEKLYELNGSIYIAEPHTVLTKQTFHIDQPLAYVMSHEESIDINEPEDFTEAEFVLEKKKIK